MRTIQLKYLEKLPYGPEEALNRLRVNVGFCGDSFKKIIITSSTPNEGKSFVSVNLWRMLAETGSKVVLVDADMRKSVLRGRYQITSEDGSTLGLVHYLAGQAELDEVLCQTNINNGYMMPVTTTVSNTAILLQTERFDNLLNELAKDFDYVLVDTPPLGSVADGDLIASRCDGGLLVVRSGVTPRGMVASSLKQLERAGCKLMGVVLNRVEAKSNPYYYYRYSKYGYYNSYYYYGSDKESRK